MTPTALFNLLGGKAAIQVITGCSRQNVNHWLHNGVPHKYWPAIRAEARRRRVPGITDEALASTRDRRGARPKGKAPPKIRRRLVQERQVAA